MADNSGPGLKGSFVGTGQGLRVKSLLFKTLQVLPHAHTQTHTLTHAHVYVRGTFPAFVAEADLGEFDLGCANFSLRGQGWRWCLCAAGGCEGRRQKDKEKIFFVLSRLQRREREKKVT